LKIDKRKEGIPMKKGIFFLTLLMLVSANTIPPWFVHAAEAADYAKPPIVLSPSIRK
jgi:hypothetical protein